MFDLKFKFKLIIKQKKLVKFIEHITEKLTI